MRGLGSHWSSCLEYMRVSTQPPGKTLCTWQLLTIPHRGQQVLASSQCCCSGWSASQLLLQWPLSWPAFLPPISHPEGSLPSSSGLGTSVYHLACPLQVVWKCPNHPKADLAVGSLTACLQVAMENCLENWVATQMRSTSDTVTLFIPFSVSQSDTRCL